MSFSDLLDIINPLQQLPIVSTIYRAITGDPSPRAGAPSSRPIRRPRRTVYPPCRRPAIEFFDAETAEVRQYYNKEEDRVGGSARNGPWNNTNLR